MDFYSLQSDNCPIDFDLLAEHIIEHEQFDEVDFDADPYLSDDE